MATGHANPRTELHFAIAVTLFRDAPYEGHTCKMGSQMHNATSPQTTKYQESRIEKETLGKPENEFGGDTH